MGEDVSGECAGEDCTTTATIDSSSIGFISSAAGIAREEALRCDACLSELLSDVTLDLSIGSAHTHSEEFEAQREQRKGMFTDEDDDEEEEAVAVLHDPHDTKWGWKVFIDAPDSARQAITSLDHDRAHPAYHNQQGEFEVDLSAVDYVTETLPGEGYEVEVAPEVRRALADLQ